MKQIEFLACCTTRLFPIIYSHRFSSQIVNLVFAFLSIEYTTDTVQYTTVQYTTATVPLEPKIKPLCLHFSFLGLCHLQSKTAFNSANIILKSYLYLFANQVFSRVPEERKNLSVSRREVCVRFLKDTLCFVLVALLNIFKWPNFMVLYSQWRQLGTSKSH